MNEKVRNLMREIERRGGRVGLSDAIPDDVAEQFLRGVLSCSDCGDETEERFSEREPIDWILAGTVPRRGKDH